MGADRYFEARDRAALCTRIHAEDEATLAALERARVVGVLDVWAEKHKSLNWASWPDCGPNGYACCLTHLDDSTRDFYGPTPDAARAAAAKAIEAGEV